MALETGIHLISGLNCSLRGRRRCFSIWRPLPMRYKNILVSFLLFLNILVFSLMVSFFSGHRSLSFIRIFIVQWFSSIFWRSLVLHFDFSQSCLSKFIWIDFNFWRLAASCFLLCLSLSINYRNSRFII